ncbi:MAG: hypothetical protein K0S33_3023 [Bacteroidetes bacterium]|jgi:hypothetical protein|nr:hypothetical protein [Bacteroidota bacterium]
MFGLFGKKEDKIAEAKVMSHIAASRAEALNALAIKLKQKPGHVFWFFRETKNQFINYLQQHGITYHEEAAPLDKTDAVYLHDATKFSSSAPAAEWTFYCIDYFPSHFEFNKLQRHLALVNPKADLHVYAGLDEPLFKIFGGDRILVLMKRMGMKEGELVEHRIIAESVTKSQKKIEEHSSSFLPADSAQEWFSKNFPDNKI